MDLSPTPEMVAETSETNLFETPEIIAIVSDIDSTQTPEMMVEGEESQTELFDTPEVVIAETNNENLSPYRLCLLLLREFGLSLCHLLLQFLLQFGLGFRY